IVGFIAYIIIMLISNPITKILYQQWYSESLKLIPITNLNAIVMAITSVINSIILRFKKINWQLIINGVTLLIYIICSLLFFNLWGLVGFCLGILFANLIKLIFTTFIYFI